VLGARSLHAADAGVAQDGSTSSVRAPTHQ